MCTTYAFLPESLTMTEKSGIYCIYFENLEGEYYIGCAISIYTRVQNHKSALLRGNHHNYKLQNAYNKYGMPVFDTIEECSIDILHDKEIFYIREFNSYIAGFNLTLGGEGASYGEANPFAKYSISEYCNVVKELAYTNNAYNLISTNTGVSLEVVKKIAALKTHNYLSDILPEEYKILVSKYTEGRNNSAKSKDIRYPIIISPDGIEYTVENVHKFAEEHGLQYQNLHKVLTSKRISHKLWKLKI